MKQLTIFKNTISEETKYLYKQILVHLERGSNFSGRNELETTTWLCCHVGEPICPICGKNCTCSQKYWELEQSIPYVGKEYANILSAIKELTQSGYFAPQTMWLRKARSQEKLKMAVVSNGFMLEEADEDSIYEVIAKSSFELNLWLKRKGREK